MDRQVYNFGGALEALKEGKKVARNGWNGKGMFLIYISGTVNCEFKEGSPYYNAIVVNDSLTNPFADINPHIDMYTADGKFQPGWLASQTDMLADDWIIIN